MKPYIIILILLSVIYTMANSSTECPATIEDLEESSWFEGGPDSNKSIKQEVLHFLVDHLA